MDGRPINIGMSSFLLKISLRGTPNLIWRRFVVPSFTTLNRLHETVQIIMGWRRMYSHAFYLQRQAYVPTKNPLVDGLPEEMFSLDDLLFRGGSKLKYLYDPAGARWTHDIVVESTRYVNPSWTGPIYCLEGVRACPPESCAGPDGFTELLKILKTPKNPEYAKWLERFGDVDFDAFDVERVNKMLKAKRSAERQNALPIQVVSPPKTKKEPSSVPLDPLHRLGLTLKNKAAS